MMFDHQVNYLMFTRSECEGNFQLYILALRKCIKWYFIFDKFNYSWWLGVHLFDLMTVETMFPDIYENFNKRAFKCGFTLKCVHDMLRTCSQMNRTDKYLQHSSIIWPVWLNVWVFIYEPSGCGFESRCSHLRILYFSKIRKPIFSDRSWSGSQAE